MFEQKFTSFDTSPGRIDATELTSGDRFDVHVGTGLPSKEEGIRQAAAVVEAALRDRNATPEELSRLAAQQISLVSFQTVRLRHNKTQTAEPAPNLDEFRRERAEADELARQGDGRINLEDDDPKGLDPMAWVDTLEGSSSQDGNRMNGYEPTGSQR